MAKIFSDSRGLKVLNIVENQSTGQGIKDIISAKVEIARSSRALKKEEVQLGMSSGQYLRSYLVGYGPIALTVNSKFNSKLKHLSMKQIKDIYFNENVTDWSQIQKGLKGPITALFKYEHGGSGTIDAFKEIIDISTWRR